MPRFYDPKTGTEALEGIHDMDGATADDDMPAESRKWFDDDPVPEGKVWAVDPTGKFPILVDIPAPTADEIAQDDRAWAQSELLLTDRVLVSDSPYSKADQDKVTAYRHKLRNPQRAAKDWQRPEWPKDVKRPE